VTVRAAAEASGSGISSYPEGTQPVARGFGINHPQLRVEFRPATGADHARVVAVVDDWWGGRSMAPLLQRLFFDHFGPTSFIAESEAELAGFLIGFVSPGKAGTAYVHFVGVEPGRRGSGLGTELYRRFFGVARGAGCRWVECITGPVNTGSIAFHTRLGFEVVPGGLVRDGVDVHPDYDGPGHDRVLFRYDLEKPQGF
jgi:ribosomal protein S18 acetylase RimI-like enzyme